MKQTTEDVLNNIKEKSKNHEFMKTGFGEIDDFLDGGFFKGETIILGAHTGIGKSQVAGQVFHNIAKQGYKSAYISLEISSEMILSRLVGAEVDIKPTRVRYGRLNEQEFRSKKKSEAALVGLGEFVNFYDSVYELSQIIREVKENEYEFVVVDFIQNVIEKSPNEYARLTNIAQKLQQLARESNSCIMILSQLSNIAAKEGSRSKTVEYKGSGAIATICDLGFFLERERFDNPEDAYTKKVHNVTLTIMKNRRGISGIPFELYYQQPGGQIAEKF